MTKENILKAQTRENEKMSDLRAKALLPAVLYGPKLEKNLNIKIGLVDFEKLYNEVGEASLIDLRIDDGDTLKVIVKDVQYDSVKGRVNHVDFYGVDMTKKLITPIPLNYIGESNAVKKGALLMKNADSVEVECLPNDLISRIDVDLSLLDTVDDVIRIKDLSVPATVVMTHDDEEVIASVSEAKTEVESTSTEDGAEAGEKTDTDKEEEKK